MFDREQLPSVRGTYRYDVDLSKTTWFGVGGKADVLFRPFNTNDLSYFLRKKPKEIPVYVLGVGSNILVRDKGIRGVVIKLGRCFCEITHNKEFLISGAGAMDLNVAYYAMKNGISGVEFLSGIPGTIGGALKMNAGAYGTEIADVLVKAEAVDMEGNILILDKQDLQYVYRGSKLDKNLVFTKAWFKYSSAEPIEIKKRIDEINQKRNSTQPVRSRTGGSTFKNPGNYKSWELIDKVGLRGYKIGGAKFSEQHCNFIVNEGNATADDIEQLGELARKKVQEQFGINLEWEIKIIGER